MAPGLKAGECCRSGLAAVAAASARGRWMRGCGGAEAWSSGRGRDVTLVVPDAAVRVLLLDFDELPAKAARRCRWCGSG